MTRLYGIILNYVPLDPYTLSHSRYWFKSAEETLERTTLNAALKSFRVTARTCFEAQWQNTTLIFNEKKIEDFLAISSQ